MSYICVSYKMSNDNKENFITDASKQYYEEEVVPHPEDIFLE